MKKEVLCAVIGGVVGAVLTIAAGTFSSLEAKDEAKNLNLGQITCTGLSVVDSGRLIILNKDGNVQAEMSAGEHGGYVYFWSRDGHRPVAGMEALVGLGGQVYVSGDSSDFPKASMEASNDQAAIKVFGKDEGLRAYMRIDGKDGLGEGVVGTCDQNGYPLATLE